LQNKKVNFIGYIWIVGCSWFIKNNNF